MPNYKTDSGTGKNSRKFPYFKNLLAGALKYSPLNERIKSAAPLDLEKDFIKLNRIGVRQGIVTAQDQKNVSRLTTVELDLICTY